MSLKIRFQFPTRVQLGFTVERLADGHRLDPESGEFGPAAPKTTAPLPEGEGIDVGSYSADVDAAGWPDGDYAVRVHHLVEDRAVVAILGSTLIGGDDATPVAPKLAKVTTVAIGGVALDLYGLPAKSPAPAPPPG